MGGSPRSQRLGFISVYHGKKSELCEVDLVSGERELCPILFRFYVLALAGWIFMFQCWQGLLFSLLIGPATNPSRSILSTGQDQTHMTAPIHNPARDRRKVTFQKRRNPSTPCVFSGDPGR